MPIIKVDQSGNISRISKPTEWHHTSESELPDPHQKKKPEKFEDVPDPVDHYTLENITPESVTIKWKKPSSNNSDITQYSIYLDNELHNVSEITESQINGLIPDTSYTFHVTGQNLIGEGYTTEHKLKFATLPASLQRLQLNEKHEQVNQLKLYAWGSDRRLALGLLDEGGDRTASVYNKSQKCMVQPHRLSAFHDTDVVGVDGGCKSTVVLDAENQIIEFGDTLHSLMHLQGKESSDEPSYNIIQISSKIRKVAAGEKFAMALSAEGHVYTWGSNSYSTLGVKNEVESGVPFAGSLEPVNLSQSGDLAFQFIVDISCSYSACLALSDLGKVIAWGNEALLVKEGFPASSAPNHTVVTPTFLNLGAGERVKSIASGRYHHAFVTDIGECHTFGCNNYLQLGYQTEQNLDLLGRKVPQIREGGWSCVECFCGLDFTLALLKRENERKLVAWGRNKKGQCGVGTESIHNSILPQQCLFKHSAQTDELLHTLPEIQKVAAGQKHSLVLDKEGRVWSCGNQAKGQVGQGVCGTGIFAYFTLISEFGEVRDIAAGEQHSLAIVQGKRI